METQTVGTELGNREFFIQRWEQEYPAFVRLFGALPPGALDYRPHPLSRSAGEIVALLVTSQQGCISLCKSNRSMYNGIRWEEPKSVGKLDDMIATFESDHDVLDQHLHELEPDAWNHPAWLLRGSEEILLKNSVGGLMWIALFDEVHHRGQLSTYVRSMGGKVPSIYGPSADDGA